MAFAILCFMWSWSCVFD